MKKSVILIAFCFACFLARAQEPQPDRVTVPFSDPSRPKTLKVSLIHGSISVKGYEGRDAIFEGRPSSASRRAERPERSDGLRRIDPGGTGLTVEESDNVITAGSRSPGESLNLSIQVPIDTSVKLHTLNGGAITVDHITGDVEIDITNGQATATHISGTAVLHALNGKVLASFDKVAADKPMSFSSLNGDIDVTLPADVKTRVKMKSDNGAVYSDFDVTLDPSARQPVVQDSKSGRGRYRVQFDRSMTGTLNGGGPDMQFTTYNGNIYLRKAK